MRYELVAIAAVLVLAVIGAAYLLHGGSPLAPPPVEYNHTITGKTNSTGAEITVMENRTAANVSFTTLKDFVVRDTTNQLPYTDPTFTCADYAMRLHDNAERNGIQAAIVCLQIEGNTGGHAIVAFNTTDKGVVYIDDSKGEYQYDYVGYPQIGKEYGVIPLPYFTSPNYASYESYKQDRYAHYHAVELYNQRVNEHNDRCNQYNTTAKEYTDMVVNHNNLVQYYNNASTNNSLTYQQVNTLYAQIKAEEDVIKMKYNSTQQLKTDIQNETAELANQKANIEASTDLPYTPPMGVVTALDAYW